MQYFEDHVQGAAQELGHVVVDAAEMQRFAERYDPQVFHVDPAQAAKTPFGGLVASGWYTACLAMRLIVDRYLGDAANLGSPGIDELRWLLPVRPGDRLSVTRTVIETRKSRTKPDRGIVRSIIEVTNQDRRLVLTWKGVNIVQCRPGAFRA